MTFPPSASMENPSIPNAIHSFSSAASEVEPPVWPKFLLRFIINYFGLLLLWTFTSFVVSTSCATASYISTVPHRLAHPLNAFYRSALGFVANFVACFITLLVVLACLFAIIYHLIRFHPRLLLEGYRRGFDARHVHLIMEALERERGADSQAHSQQAEEQRAASMALQQLFDEVLRDVLGDTARVAAGVAARQPAGNAAGDATVTAPRPAAGPAALRLR